MTRLLLALAAGVTIGVVAALALVYQREPVRVDRDADDGIQPPDPRTWEVTVPPACERGPDSWRLREVGR